MRSFCCKDAANISTLGCFSFDYAELSCDYEELQLRNCCYCANDSALMRICGIAEYGCGYCWRLPYSRYSSVRITTVLYISGPHRAVANPVAARLVVLSFAIARLLWSGQVKGGDVATSACQSPVRTTSGRRDGRCTRTRTTVRVREGTVPYCSVLCDFDARVLYPYPCEYETTSTTVTVRYGAVLLPPAGVSQMLCIEMCFAFLAAVPSVRRNSPFATRYGRIPSRCPRRNSPKNVNIKKYYRLVRFSADKYDGTEPI